MSHSFCAFLCSTLSLTQVTAVEEVTEEEEED